MFESLIVLLVLIILYGFYEYRLRKPDQIVLFEKNNNISARKGRFYPRHFSLAIPGNVQSRLIEIEAEAKGHILINVRIAVTAAASNDHLSQLIRAGGWTAKCITNALDASKVILEAMVKEYCEKFEIEELSSEKLTESLKNKIVDEAHKLGLVFVSLTSQSIEPKDKEITIALQQQEEARLKEQTEKSQQKTRIAIAKSKAEADEQILKTEHELELKKLDLRKVREDNEAKIADQRVKEELERKKLQLEFEQKEMELLKNSPELLMLSPQLARLAEASQQLPNAKTIVSLSANDVQKGSQIVETIQTLLQNVLAGKTQGNQK
ncbi:MAG: hypothetical protein H6627_04030 [Calditrichae bacterium]|nr:hypothetical protein [Calditrichota bacterium]MCB9057710.1 hypothetical protein [Calditrichia bacterium]